MDSYSVLAVLIFSATALVFSLAQGRDGRRRTLLATALAAAALGTWVALDHRATLATTLLISAAAAIAIVSLATRAESPLGQDKGPIGRKEWALLISIVVGAGLLRFSGLDRFPDFIHGEENIWTWQVARKLFSTDHPWPISWYSKGVPVSYAQEWPFFRVLGLSYVAPRYEVAFFGTLTVGLFYFLARTVAGVRIALFSTVLLATSMVALAASRAAFVQSHVLFWTVAAYYLYVQAVERRSPLLYLLTGGTLALGALTYQTFVTAIPVVGLHFLYEAARDSKRWRSHVINLTLLASPVLLVWPRVWWYLGTQQGHVSSGQGSLTEIAGSPLEVPGEYLSAAWHNLKFMFENLFYRQTYADYLIIRPERPIFLAGVTALALVGVALVVPRARQRWPAFLLLWLFIQTSFSPVVLDAPFIRALLPAYPALFLFAGVGLGAVLPNLQNTTPRLLRYASLGVMLAVTGALATTGALAYFTETQDTPEGQVRQSLSDTVDEYARSDTLLVFPYRPNTWDLVENERESIRFMVAGATGGFEKALQFYALVSEEQFLTALQANGSDARRAVVVVQDKDAPDEAEQVRMSVTAALQRCYPGIRWEKHDFLVAGIIEDRFSGECDATATLEPGAVGDARASLPTTLRWTSSPDAGPFAIEIQRRRDGVEDYEMEGFAPSNGWGSEAKYATGYSGSGYYYDDVTAGTAVVNLPIAGSGTYTLWFRTYRRVSDNTHRWVSIDGQMLGELSPPEGRPLGQWTWEALDPISLQADSHRLELSRQGSGPALFIDALYVSQRTGFDPNRDDLWITALKAEAPERPESGQSLTLGESLSPGKYRWRVASLNDRLVTGLGEPLVSTFVEFIVRP